MSRLDAAIALLSTATREELRDHAFGDCEVYWRVDGHEVGYGYFGGDHCSVTVNPNEPVTFKGADAQQLRHIGKLGLVERNDSTGPDDYREGDCMPGLTLEGVRRELCDPDYDPNEPDDRGDCEECGAPTMRGLCSDCRRALAETGGGT